MNYMKWARRMGLDTQGEWQRNPAYQATNIEWFKRDDPDGYERDLRGEPPPLELNDARQIEVPFRIVEKRNE